MAVRATPYSKLEPSATLPLQCSLVAATFSGQFKSVIRCEKCGPGLGPAGLITEAVSGGAANDLGDLELWAQGHLNAAFDPFSFLPVPLPEHDFRWPLDSFWEPMVEVNGARNCSNAEAFPAVDCGVQGWVTCIVVFSATGGVGQQTLQACCSISGTVN